ncbi:MAG: hypothetical protein ACRD1X_21010 [Vicinamibacteria bacterium]
MAKSDAALAQADSFFISLLVRSASTEEKGMGHLRTVPLIVLAVLGGSASPIAGRVAVQVPASREVLAADVGSIDAIIGALYDVISGPAGDRDWDRMRSLFL